MIELTVNRVRIRYAKRGDLRFISHRDLMRAFERLLKRAGLAVCLSQGFHPKPRMRFPAALALGCEGLDEVMEVDLVEEVPPAELVATLNAHAPCGLSFHSAEIIPTTAKSARARAIAFEMPLPPDRIEAVQLAIERLLAAGSYSIERPEGKAPLDLRSSIEHIAVDAGVLCMTLRVTDQAGARPRDVLGAIGLGDLARTGALLTRTHVELAP